jgi:hypothetical protein
MDQIGNILVPEIVSSGVFPIVPEYPYSLSYGPQIVEHQFGSGNAKVMQRFLLGTGAKRFTVRRAWLTDPQRIALRNFWEARQGPYGAFTYNAPNDDGNGTTAYTVRFANEPLSWEMVADWASILGVTLIEIPATSPVYPLNSTVTRFPSAALETALLSQVQELIPLIKIQPLQAGYPAIYVSDRRCMVGGQPYQARLLEFDGIQQSMGGESDLATFTFGNADRVMRDLANDVDLYRASIEFSLFHVGTGIKLDLWRGNINDWSCDAGPEFKLTASDGLYELNLPYPCRKTSRTCWKPFGGNGCPYAGALDLVHFPNADAGTCDKGYDTPNGCLAHVMKRYFGGLLVEPQGVKVKDNSTGTWGFGRSPLTSVSLVSDSIYDQVIPEIYTDQDMPVNCKIAAGRDESDFYEGMGVVGEGPLGGFSLQHMEDLDGDGKKETFVGSTLDGQYNHGAKFDSNGNPTGDSDGLRMCLGNDPAGPTDYFSLDQSGDQRAGDWRRVYDGYSTYKDNFAAGTAFIVIRRTDAKGLQLSQLTEHQMQAYVSSGIGGWVWSAPGSRVYSAPLTNPIWIAVNMLLRARGIRLGAAATASQLNIAETFFDVDAAVAAAGVCASSVQKLVGDGYETQFKFIGVLQEEKPLRDWLQEILMNCLGYYTFAFGKMKLGVRMNSSTMEAFTEGNILFRSLQLAPIKPSFNHLTANFADGEFQFQNNSVTLYDADNAALLGGGAGPLFLKSNVNLSGTASKSQAARIVSVRLREELGGITADEWKRARSLGFRTTVLALATEPGMVCSMTHPDMPGGAGEFRVTGWKLNKDYSIDIEGRTTTDSMYDMVNGPKPADVPAASVPVELVATIPDDVLPIGGNAFLFTKTEDGKNATYTLEYEPPDPIGIFAGVTLHVEAPDGTGQIAFTQDFDYNGDAAAAVGTQARHGTCTFSFPQSLDAAVQIRMYLASRSRVYKKPLVLATQTAPTPNRTDAVSKGSTFTLPGDAPNVGPDTSAVVWYKYIPGSADTGWVFGFEGNVVTPPDVSNWKGVEIYLHWITGYTDPGDGGPLIPNYDPRYLAIEHTDENGGQWHANDPGFPLAKGFSQDVDVVFVSKNALGVENPKAGAFTKRLTVSDSGLTQQNPAAPTLTAAAAEYKPVDGSWEFRLCGWIQHPLDTSNCKGTRIRVLWDGDTRYPLDIWFEPVSSGAGTHEGYSGWFSVAQGFSQAVTIGALAVNLKDQEPDWSDASVPKQTITVSWADALSSGPNGGFPTSRLARNTLRDGMRIIGLDGDPNQGIGVNAGAGLTFDYNKAVVPNLAYNGGLGVNGSSQMYVPLGAISSGNLASGTLSDLSKYTSDKRPIVIAYGTPYLPDSNYPNGALLFNTYDGKLYRNVNGTWKKDADPADLIAGTIAAGVVYAGRIAASQIDAGTMTVGSGGITFSGAGGVNVTSGGNVIVTPGHISSQGGIYMQNVSEGFNITTAYPATIQGASMNSRVNVGSYMVGGYTVIDSNRNLMNVTLPSHAHSESDIANLAADLANKVNKLTVNSFELKGDITIQAGDGISLSASAGLLTITNSDPGSGSMLSGYTGYVYTGSGQLYFENGLLISA